MSKSEFIASQLQAVQAAQTQAIGDALSATWDESALEQKESDGTLTEADVAARVKEATDPLNAQIAELTAKDAADVQALADAQAKAATDLAAVQQALTDMTAKEQLEEQAVADVNAKILAVQASFDQIKSIFASLNPPAST